MPLVLLISSSRLFYGLLGLNSDIVTLSPPLILFCRVVVRVGDIIF